MYIIHDERVTVHKAPGIKARPVAELASGDVVDIITPFYKLKERDGVLWIRTQLPSGIRGYIREDVLVENIGDEAGKCPAEICEKLAALKKKRHRKALLIALLCAALILCGLFIPPLIENMVNEHRISEIERLSLCLQNSDHNVRISAINSLAEIGDVDAALALTYALGDTDEEVRQSAIDAFVRIEGDYAYIALSNALHNEDSLVCQNALEAFMKSRCESTTKVATLIDNLLNEDPVLRETIRNTLIGMGSEYTVDALCDELDTYIDNDISEFGAAVIDVLAEIGGDQAVKKLVYAFQYAYNTGECAANAFAKIGYEDSAAELILALHNENSNVRKYAAVAFGRIGDARASQELIAAIQDSVTDVRISAIDALGEIRDESAVEPLIAALTDTEMSVRISAINALGEIHDMRAVEPLITIFKYHNDKTKDAAASALVKIGGEQAEDALIPVMNELITVLEDNESDKQYDAAESLSMYGPLAVVPLTDILDDREGTARFFAAYALAGMDADQAANRLDAAYDDLDLQVIAGAADYYIKEGKKGSESVLISALNEYGNTRLANTFLNCGNELLENAAYKWADAHGLDITFTYSSTGDSSFQWGSK